MRIVFYINDTIKDKFINKTILRLNMETKNQEKTQIWGILSLISGILGILSFLLIPIVSIIFSILAVIFSIVQKNYEFTTAAKIGLTLGILGVIISFIVGFASFGEPYSESTIVSSID